MRLKKKFIGNIIAAMAMATTLTVVPTSSKADTNPYIGDILIAGYNFCPRGWVPANGALYPIANYTAAFSLWGTVYGGDGRTTFGVPDLQGRMAAGQGSGPGLTTRLQGQKYGASTRTLTEQNLPAHSHTVYANNLDGDKPGPGGKLLAAAPPNGAGSETIYSDQPATTQMSSQMIANKGGGQPVSVADPTLVLTYCVALVGLYPSRP